jgi:hypothetical protein
VTVPDPFEALLRGEYARQYQDGNVVFDSLYAFLEIQDLLTIDDREYWRVVSAYSYRASRAAGVPGAFSVAALRRDHNALPQGHDAWFSGPPDLPLNVGVECLTINGEAPTWDSASGAWKGRHSPVEESGWFPVSYTVRVLTRADRPVVWSRIPVFCHGVAYKVKYRRDWERRPVVLPFTRGGHRTEDVTGLDDQRWVEETWAAGGVHLPGEGIAVTW